MSTSSRDSSKKYPLIVTTAVIRQDGKVLVARRQGGHLAGKWEFPGGKLEPGESPEQCLARELKEELELEVRVGDIFAVVYHEYESGADTAPRLHLHPGRRLRAWRRQPVSWYGAVGFLGGARRP